MEVAEGLPQPDQQSQHDPQRMNRGLDVVAKEFRIAENKTGAPVVVGVPGGERQQRNQKQERILQAAPESSIAIRFHP